MAKLKSLVISNEEIKNLYLFGLSCIKISKIAECHNSTIGRILNKMNIQIRNPSETKRKYQLNENYFDSIDSEEKAYFLGFLYADGSNMTEKFVVKLSLQEKDKYILEKFSSLIYINKKELTYVKPKIILTKYISSPQYIFKICNKHISKQLNKLGVFKAKTFILKFPTEDQVPSHLIHHFIRGYFDGDGSIFISKKNNRIRQFTICGNHNFLLSLQEILIKECQLTKTKLSCNNNIYILVYNGINQTERIKNFLYQNATVYLERKYNKFLIPKN